MAKHSLSIEQNQKQAVTVRIYIRGKGQKERTFKTREQAEKWINKLREDDQVEVLGWSDDAK